MIKLMDKLWTSAGRRAAPRCLGRGEPRRLVASAAALTHSLRAFSAGLLLGMTPYGVVSTGPERGLVEVVLNSETMAGINRKAGG